MSTDDLSLRNEAPSRHDSATTGHAVVMPVPPERTATLVLQERERIAQGLHDHVVQLLFGTGLGLQNFAATVEDANTRAHIQHAVAGIDEAITQIRAVVLDLTAENSMPRASARRVIRTVAEESTRGFGPAAKVTFNGPVDLIVTPRLLDDICAVVRECLSNVVRHANAATVTVSVRVDGSTVSVLVRDNGTGIPRGGRRSGLNNIQARASGHGGKLLITSQPGRTQILWIVPIPDSPTQPLPRS